MKTITLITYNRPQYLKETIAALRENNTKDFTLYVGMEPGNEECQQLIRSINFMPVVAWVNPFKMGVNINAFVTQARAFDALSELNVYLEDDVVLSPDALDLALWYHQLKDKSNHLGVCFSGPWSNPAWPNCVHKVEPTAVALGAGFAITAWQWQSFWRRHWFSELAQYWDKTIETLAIARKMTVLRPRLVRSKCIGAFGVTHQGNNDEFFISNPISNQKNTQFYWRD